MKTNQMKLAENQQIGDWLSSLEEERKNSRPIKIRHLMPDTFDHYFLILWPVGILADFPFDEVITPTASIEQINSNIEIWNKFNVLYDSQTVEYRRLSYKEVSQKFGLKYDKTIIDNIDWNKRGLAILEADAGQMLEALIKKLNVSEQLNLLVEDRFRWEEFGSDNVPDDGKVFSVTESEFINFLEKTNFDSENYLFPDDKSWCLKHFEDLTVSLLGISHQFIDLIKNLDLNDMFTVTPDDIF